MPLESRGLEPIKCLEDDEGVSFQLTKFRTRNDVDLFLHFSLEISVPDVGGPKIKVIELSQEDKELDASE